MSEKSIMIIFVVVFIVYMLIGVAIFSLNKNVDLKKRFFPFSVIIGCLIFGSLMFIQFYPRIFPILIFLPGLALIAYLNIKFTKFCDHCGKFRYNRTFWEKMNFCPVCGDKFNN
jgi:hypothetical protein